MNLLTANTVLMALEALYDGEEEEAIRYLAHIDKKSLPDVANALGRLEHLCDKEIAGVF